MGDEMSASVFLVLTIGCLLRCKCACSKNSRTKTGFG